MKLGAFEYLRKPVDISKLSEVIKKAHEKADRSAR
jgi:FixJ family two-component response regulator